MITLLSDYNCERQAKEILYRLRRLGYGEQLGIEILFFKDVNLSINSNDEEVWQLCQQNGYYLLTSNRNTKDAETSLHGVLGRLANEKSLPVITIGDPRRVISDGVYCQACAESIMQIIFNAELYLGVPRLYIP